MKQLKKILAIIGVVSMIFCTIAFAVSADDIETENNYEIKDYYNLSRIYMQTDDTYKITVGTPNTVWASYDYRLEWNSGDQFALYLRNGVYDYVNFTHYGELLAPPSGQNGYKVKDVYPIAEHEHFNEGITYVYDTFCYYGEFMQSLLDYETSTDGFDVISWADDSLVPYVLLTRFQDMSITGVGEITYSYKIGNSDEIITEKTDAYFNGVECLIPFTPPSYDGTEDLYLRDYTISFTPKNAEYNGLYTYEYVTFYQFFDTDGYPINAYDYKSGNENYIDINMADFLLGTASGFLAFELMPGLSFAIILAVIICIPLAIVFLKHFAGG